MESQMTMKWGPSELILELIKDPILSHAISDIYKLEAENSQLKEAGLGYSQQTVDALTAERDKLLAENVRLKEIISEAVLLMDDEPMKKELEKALKT